MGKPGRTAPRDFGLEPQICAPVAQHDIAAPPRALSTGEPGWRRFAGRINITLDSTDVTRRCVGFDCDKGTMTRQRIDEAGRIFVDPATNGVAVETPTGVVRVAWK